MTDSQLPSFSNAMFQKYIQAREWIKSADIMDALKKDSVQKSCEKNKNKNRTSTFYIATI